MSHSEGPKCLEEGGDGAAGCSRRPGRAALAAPQETYGVVNPGDELLETGAERNKRDGESNEFWYLQVLFTKSKSLCFWLRFDGKDQFVVWWGFLYFVLVFLLCFVWSSLE